MNISFYLVCLPSRLEQPFILSAGEEEEFVCQDLQKNIFNMRKLMCRNKELAFFIFCLILIIVGFIVFVIDYIVGIQYALFEVYIKKILPLLSRISIVFHVIPINSCYPCRRILESSTGIQDRFPGSSFADLFKKSLQINVSPTRQLQ